MVRLITITLFVLIMTAGLTRAQDLATPTQSPQTLDNTDPTPKTGRYTTTFTERSPLSTVEAVTSRFRAKLRQPPEDYVLADESFQVYVPESYDGTERFGLIVWVSPSPNGAPPENYLPILDQHKLIWIGANNSGNPRSFWHRAGLSLDGLRNITSRYDIDPMRTYISGLSGGGRCSSRIGLTYADLFAGAFPIIGVDFFIRLPHPDSTAIRLLFWAPAFNPPQPRILRKAKRDNRYVLLTGETDGNRAQTRTVFQYGFKRARFNYITYLEVPGMGHTLPPADWFEKGITALDEPIDEVRDRRETEAQKAMTKAMDRLQRSPKHGVEALENLLRDFPDTSFAKQAEEALRKARDQGVIAQMQAAQTGDKEPADAPPLRDDPRETLSLAKNYLKAGLAELARDLLNQLIQDHPDADEAEQARALLEGMTAQN